MVLSLCSTSSLALTYQPELKPEFLIMIEIMGMNMDVALKVGELLAKATESRRDIWPSRAEAYRLLKARAAYRQWDDRLLRILVEKGMRLLPTPQYPDKEGVTLKCTRRMETAAYRDDLASPTAYAVMRFIVKRFRTHFIDGTVNNYLWVLFVSTAQLGYLRRRGLISRSRDIKDDFLGNAVRGMQNLASFSHISGAGHLVSYNYCVRRSKTT
ncbi:AB hydrolase-1 domain-containing protein [Mycena sanguinolenta]|uniref:AB hydrolase-1 domain-containing protein n=1 Tax=Mycena sanguinolenta TaxID=230812 RepID=A0A8H6Y8Z0_9AGAR|nr:AB hydrolase-1 domain-containing protein [Mycena sanguinolenta]